MKVYNLSEAKNFFLENSSGSITCVKNGKEKECNSYVEALAFFNDL